VDQSCGAQPVTISNRPPTARAEHAVPATTRTALVHSDKADDFDYGREHPLRMERLGLTWRLMRAYGLTALPEARVVAPEPAAETDIARYHTREYLDVLKRADRGLDPADGAVYGLGLGDNPVFRGLWEVAQLVATGQAERAFHFAGGLHHAFPDRASGFCYVNDAVLAILRLREHGLRVAYIDIDAHHGDGVQHAFYADPNVMTISTHERGERLFPGTGFVREKGEGAGVGFSVNLPLEAYTDSAVYLPAFEAVVPPLIERFRPDVIVAQLGVDAHRTDPLTHLGLDVQGFARAVQRIAALAPRLVALGGGGYDLRNVPRMWTAAWAVLNGVELAPTLPDAFADDMRRYGFTSSSLWDEPVALPDELRRAVSDYVDRQVDAVQKTIFPLHDL
jgi:acetoin utilization protein AcuC